jgi:predicted nucleic acid-binding protein
MLSRAILLDTNILGYITDPISSSTIVKECQQWFRRLLKLGEIFILPEISDYELRRELIRGNKEKALARLDDLKSIILYLPLDTEAMVLASQLWAEARNKGKPFTHDRALDGDVILAAQAKSKNLSSHSDVIVVTNNKKHLSCFVDAREWQEIT